MLHAVPMPTGPLGTPPRAALHPCVARMFPGMGDLATGPQSQLIEHYSPSSVLPGPCSSALGLPVHRTESTEKRSSNGSSGESNDVPQDVTPEKRMPGYPARSGGMPDILGSPGCPRVSAKGTGQQRSQRRSTFECGGMTCNYVPTVLHRKVTTVVHTEANILGPAAVRQQVTSVVTASAE